MSVAFNREEIDDLSNEDSLKKIKEEQKTFKDMKIFLRKINSEFEKEYIVSGSVIDANDFKEELVALLLLNYRRTGKKFKFDIRESFGEEVSRELGFRIDRSLEANYKNLVNRSSDLILQTTNKEISNELINTVGDFTENNIEINDIGVASVTKKNLNEKVDGRANTIAISETENAAEEAKEVEKQVLANAGIILAGIPIASLKDRWITKRDEKVRAAHAAADNQERQLDGFFLVGGERLRRPRDPNGSAGNTINCRCEVMQTVF